MFTGIIETLGEIVYRKEEQSNIHFGIKASFANELSVDQSIAHDGVCLTVTSIKDTIYYVTAIDETLRKTTLGEKYTGNILNLERCMLLGGRLDGHIVQGHVDQTGICSEVIEQNGSWLYTFTFDEQFGNVTIEKGSITVNGTSLTVLNSFRNSFSVAIIPYTYEHTTIHTLKEGSKVNLEFDVIGKYVARLMNK